MCSIVCFLSFLYKLYLLEMGKRTKVEPENPGAQNSGQGPNSSIENLESRLQNLIDLIPPQNFGFDETVSEIVKEHKHRVVNNKLKKVDQKKLTNACKNRISRFDHDQLHTVTQIWEYLRDTGKANNQVQERPTPPARKKAKVRASGETNINSTLTPQSPGPFKLSAASREEALKKLQNKISDMKTQRKGDKTAADYEEKRKLKRKYSKIKRKEKLKLEKDSAGHTNRANKSLENGKDSSKEKAVKRNSEGNVVFSKFDFAVGAKTSWEDKSEKKLLHKRNKGTLGHKDVKKNMQNLERREKKLESLTAEGKEDEAAKMKKDQEWSTAMQKAQGIKVKDDPNLLKKSLKKQEAKKKRSTKKWDNRLKMVKGKQEEKQDKRQKNLQKRKNDKKQKVLDKARKKGRIL